MTDKELMRQAADKLSIMVGYPGLRLYHEDIRAVLTALRERLAQPEQEFTTHEEGEDGWSDWVCPDPKSYLMKCCDCGLVHEAQFAVVRYKSETEREYCDMVDDPNLQAVFRMRRSEQWTPKDTAYRPGGLAQPEQEPVVWMYQDKSTHEVRFQKHMKAFVDHSKTYETPLYAAPPRHEWVGLTDEEVKSLPQWFPSHETAAVLPLIRAIEAKLREKNA